MITFIWNFDRIYQNIVVYDNQTITKINCRERRDTKIYIQLFIDKYTNIN